MKMKKYILPILLLTLLCSTITSCMKESEDPETDDYCYISAFSLGTLKRVNHTLSSTGEDSTYITTFVAAVFPMSIDQRNLLIENHDSLPHGTRVSAALVNASFTGNLVYKTQDSEMWKKYDKSDSIDFTHPVQFMVVPSSGHGARTYTVKLNVHQLDDRLCSWTKMDSNDALADLTERKAVALDGCIVMMGRHTNGTIVCAQRSTTENTGWTLTEATGAGAANLQTLTITGQGTLAMTTTNGALLTSTDGRDWTATTMPSEGLQLLGASSSRLYAYQGGKLLSCANGGEAWEEESIDDDASLLPTQYTSMMLSQQKDGYSRLILTGYAEGSTDGRGNVWAKTWNIHSTEQEAEWMYYNHSKENPWTCPSMSPLFVMPYNHGLIAFGGQTADKRYKAMSTVFYSPDNGLTWKPSSDIVTPEELHGNTEVTAACCDDSNFIWIIAGKDTWRGHLNSLGFAK